MLDIETIKKYELAGARAEKERWIRECDRLCFAGKGVSPDMDCVKGLIDTAEKDIAELEKLQGPRILAMDEILTLPEGTDVWIELSDGTIRVDTSAATVDVRWFETNLHSFLLADYGLAWRPWTARPTDEQRKGEKWDGCS